MDRPAAVAFALAAGEPVDVGGALHVDPVPRRGSGRRRLLVAVEPVEPGRRGAEVAAAALAALREGFAAAAAEPVPVALARAFAAANAAVREENRLHPGDERCRRVLVGATAVVVQGNAVTLAQVPPGQALVLQEGWLYAFPELASWRPDYLGTEDPAGPPVPPEPLGAGSRVAPLLYRTVAAPRDLVLLCCGGVARCLAADPAIAPAGATGPTPAPPALADGRPDAALDWLGDLAAAHGLDEARAACVALGHVGGPPLSPPPAGLVLAWASARRPRVGTDAWGTRVASAATRARSRRSGSSPRPSQASWTAVGVPLGAGPAVPAEIPSVRSHLDAYLPALPPSAGGDASGEGDRWVVTGSGQRGDVRPKAAVPPVSDRDVPRTSARTTTDLADPEPRLTDGPATATDDGVLAFRRGSGRLRLPRTPLVVLLAALLAFSGSRLVMARVGGDPTAGTAPGHLAAGVESLTGLARLGALPAEMADQPVRLVRSGREIYLVGGGLYRFDPAGGHLVRLLGAGDRLPGGLPVGALRGGAADGANIVATDGVRAYVLDGTGEWAAASLGTDADPQARAAWPCAAADGSLLLLDADQGRIVELPLGSPAEPRPWSSPAVTAELRAARDLVAAGGVHVLLPDGAVRTYDAGQPAAILRPTLALPVVAPVALYAAPDSSGFYVAEAGGHDRPGRVIRVDRGTAATRQLVAPRGDGGDPLADVRDLAVDEATGTLYFVAGNAFWRATLPPTD